jgi:hypothetical protein
VGWSQASLDFMMLVCPPWEFRHISPTCSGLAVDRGRATVYRRCRRNFIALDAASGKPLLAFPDGRAVYAPPMAFAVDGKEYVAIAARSSQYTLGPALKSGYAILNGGSPTKSLVPKKESETHHAAVAGVPNSEHPREKAADIVIEG